MTQVPVAHEPEVVTQYVERETKLASVVFDHSSSALSDEAMRQIAEGIVYGGSRGLHVETGPKVRHEANRRVDIYY